MCKVIKFKSLLSFCVQVLLKIKYFNQFNIIFTCIFHSVCFVPYVYSLDLFFYYIDAFLYQKDIILDFLFFPFSCLTIYSSCFWISNMHMESKLQQKDIFTLT